MLMFSTEYGNETASVIEYHLSPCAIEAYIVLRLINRARAALSLYSAMIILFN